MRKGLNVTIALAVIGLAAYVGAAIVRNYAAMVMVAILATFAVLLVAATVAHIRKPEPIISRIDPTAGICPKCGGKQLRGPLGCLIDPAPQVWLDETLRSSFGYVWACRNCKWTDQREGQGPALFWGSKSLDITDNEREAHL